MLEEDGPDYIMSFTFRQIPECQISGNQMEHDIQDSWGNEECIRNFLIRKPKGKGPLERSRFNFKVNTKIHENVN
jgi:hypothetical protein